MSSLQSRPSQGMRSWDGAVTVISGADPADFDVNQVFKDGFTRATSDDITHRASTLRGRRKSTWKSISSDMVPAYEPLAFPKSWSPVQLGDPAIKLAEGVGAAVPDHLRCQNVINLFANFERVGTGTSSVAYRALRLSDDRRVVLKAMRRLGTGEAILAKREFALLSDLNHPNIVVALDFLESPSCVALVLEDIMGRNLRSVVRSACAGRLSELGSMRLIIQAVDGLAYLHGRKTVHRDLKPENVLISNDNVLKLIDFNVASSTEGCELLTPVGTKEFHAPELSNRPYTSSADVWSLGICVYFMLHGRTPPRTSSDLLADVPLVGPMLKDSGDADSSDASDGSSGDDINTSVGPLMRGITDHPCRAWGSCRWALQRCLHQDWQERATAQEVLVGTTSWLAEFNERVQ